MDEKINLELPATLGAHCRFRLNCRINSSFILVVLRFDPIIFAAPAMLSLIVMDDAFDVYKIQTRSQTRSVEEAT